MNSDPATVTALNYYPIKSCAGTSAESLTADALGPAQDRRFMLVDQDDIFLSQRELPKMSLINPRIEHELLLVKAPGMDDLEVPLAAGGLSRARIWNDIVAVRGTTTRAAEWFSDFLGTKCRLVYLPDDSVRPVDPYYGKPEDRTSLADGFPFLAISEASLKDLNTRLEDELPMNRFRPNIVIGGTEPFEEDAWSRIRIGVMEFRVVKPCSRCTITTVEQTTGEKGKEPLTTLATYRNSPEGVLFGQNLIHDGAGEITVGDAVEVL